MEEKRDLLNHNVQPKGKGYSSVQESTSRGRGGGGGEQQHPTTISSDRNCNHQDRIGLKQLESEEAELNQFSIYDHEPGLEYDDSVLKETKDENDDDDYEESNRRPNSSQEPLNFPLLVDSLSKSKSFQKLMSSSSNEMDNMVNFDEDFEFMNEDIDTVSEDVSIEPSSLVSIDFTDVSKYGIVEVVGDDSYGRKIITIYACRIPERINSSNSSKNLPIASQSMSCGPSAYNQTISDSMSFNFNNFLKYLMYTLDQFVETDYVIVYFHHGLNSKNKPPIKWLWQAYKLLDRKYKKNLKNLYLVHPTKFLRFVFQFFKPLISVKFGKKIKHVNYLHELSSDLQVEQLLVPKQVIVHDKKLIESISKTSWYNPVGSNPTNLPMKQSVSFHERLDSQQFKVSLKFIKEHNQGDVIARVVRECIKFLSEENSLQTEGIFRRSAPIQIVNKIKEQFNCGKSVDFHTLKIGDNGEPMYQQSSSKTVNPVDESMIHLSGVILKSFFRELEEPILTFGLYQNIIDFQPSSINHHDIEKVAVAKSYVLSRIPEDNYVVLKFLIQFLVKVMDRSDMNKMTASNLAIVWGPNLAWPQNGHISLSSITSINFFTEFLLKNHDLIFVK